MRRQLGRGRPFEVWSAFMCRFFWRPCETPTIRREKRRIVVLCPAHGLGASATVSICKLERGMPPKSDNTAVRSLSNNVSIFWLPTKHRYFGAETASYGAVRCTRGRGGECVWHDIPSRGACVNNERQYGRSKLEKLLVDF